MNVFASGPSPRLLMVDPLHRSLFGFFIFVTLEIIELCCLQLLTLVVLFGKIAESTKSDTTITLHRFVVCVHYICNIRNNRVALFLTDPFVLDIS